MGLCRNFLCCALMLVPGVALAAAAPITAAPAPAPAAQQLTSSDPVIINGEMIAEDHSWYGSAANMMVGEIHEKLQPPAK